MSRRRRLLARGIALTAQSPRAWGGVVEIGVDGGSVALNIEDPATHDLARRLAAVTGRSLTEAVRVAIEESLARAERSAAGSDEGGLVARLDAIARHCGALPVRRQRDGDDILGNDERGLPGAW